MGFFFFNVMLFSPNVYHRNPHHLVQFELNHVNCKTSNHIHKLFLSNSSLNLHHEFCTFLKETTILSIDVKCQLYFSISLLVTNYKSLGSYFFHQFKCHNMVEQNFIFSSRCSPSLKPLASKKECNTFLNYITTTQITKSLHSSTQIILHLDSRSVLSSILHTQISHLSIHKNQQEQHTHEHTKIHSKLSIIRKMLHNWNSTCFIFKNEPPQRVIISTTHILAQ